MTRSRDLANLADGVEFLAADHTKLDGIEASADVTDTANVTSAGALMDSEVTNLAQVKAFASSDYATAAQGTTANAALPKAGGTVTGNVTFGDNNKAIFGSGSDLSIYHSGSHSYISDQGTGNLHLLTNHLSVNNAADDEAILHATQDGAVTLYYNGAAKIATTATGIDVTGTTISSGTFSPSNSNWTTAAFKAAGSYGGGLAFVDGSAGYATYVQSSGGTYIIAQGSTSGALTTRLTIDSSGSVLVGKTATDSDANGVELLPNGTVYITANNTLPFYINRRGTSGDNEFARFADDGATRGKISSSFANELMVSASGTNSAGILLTSANQVRPMKNGAASNGTQDLGAGNGQWKDLYLSGGVVFGPASSSTVSSQTLSSYEEGSWTPTLPNGGSISTYLATYTKVGRVVNAYCYVTVTPTNDTAHFRVGGLPYTAKNVNNYYGGGNGPSYSSNLNTTSWSSPLVHYGQTYVYWHDLSGTGNYILGNFFSGNAKPFIFNATYFA